ncbi:MAG: response regulator [Candidatus Absconditabacterales bacterium]
MDINNKKILLADASQNGNFKMGKYFQELGIQKENIIIVTNGLDMVNKTKEELFDLIIMNTRLDIISGVDAAQQIKEHLQGNAPKIIAYTSEKVEGENNFDEVVCRSSHPEIFRRKVLDILNANQIKS